MARSRVWGRSVLVGVLVAWLAPIARAQGPDHPIITEVFTNPPGLTDGPVARDPANLHQEYIEIYLPAALRPGLNKDALRLTFYEVEGDFTSSGAGLVNYRIDLPTFDLDPSNGISAGAIARPPSGAVVMGWVDYAGNPPTDLAGTPSTRVALIDGGITSATDFVFVALNGAQFSGTTNFPVPAALSFIDMPNEATSGIIQNGSAAYLLVDRDAPGYVELYDDKNIPPGGSADPSLATGTVLGLGAMLDGLAGNDHAKFDVLAQPYAVPTGDDIDLENQLPLGGVFSLSVPQIDESKEHGYARLFVDLVKTTEDGILFNEDPVADALGVYRTISNVGPLFPTPGRVHFTNSPPELAVADASLQMFDVLSGTTGRPGVICANAGGNFGLEATAAAGASSNPAVMTTGAAASAIVLTGQTPVYPQFAVTVPAGVADGSLATAAVSVTGSNTQAGDPAVVNPNGSTTVTIRAIDPMTGQDANLSPFQATALVALQGLPDDPAAPNEFVSTGLAQFVAANLGGLVDDERHNGALLLDPATNLSDPILADVMEDDMPNDPALFINFTPAGAGLDDLVTTVLNSAEQVIGNKTYDNSFNNTLTLLKAVELNIAETITTGGTFVPAERVHYVNAQGAVALPNSGLTDVTTTRGFELALLDSNVQQFGTLETGKTDDFGLIVEVGQVGAGASVVPGEFVFLSFTGGLEGADIDSVDVPPHGNQTVIIYIDLEPLNAVLGCETITRLFVVDANGGSEVNIIEAFSLNAVPPCPRITQQPQGATVCTGGPVTFTVASDTPPPLTYQWRRNGLDIAGATGTAYTIPSAQATDAGTYDVVVTGACGFNTSNPATLALADAPSITAQPAAQTACAGAAVTFTVTAAGSGPLSYQWRKGGADLPGATGAAFTIASVQAADGGSYSVVVSNLCGSVTSAAAALTVNTAPEISGQPQSQTVCPGSAATFTVAANGSAPLGYQWRKGGVPIAGATGASFTIPAAQAADAGSYDVVVTNVCGTTTSSAASLAISNDPAILSHPQDGSVCAGGAITLSVTASGAAPLSYQWRKGGVPIIGATGATLTIDPAQAGDAGAYDVVVTSACGVSVTSNAATLAIHTPPTITQQPASQGLCAGGSVTLTVVAGGTPAPNYQWRKNNQPIPGATGSSFTINAAQPGDAGSYDVAATNVCGSVTSNAATLTVNTGPMITTQPADQMACPGGSATFTVAASGTGPLSYQWRRDGGILPGENGTTLVASTAGSYDVVITNLCGSVTSNASTLTFSSSPMIVTHPQSQSACPGGPVTFSVVANGPAPLGYQWRKGGVNLPGATGSSLTIAAAQPGDAGSYDVVVTTPCGGANGVTSNAATLTLSSGPSITLQPMNQTACEGASVTFAVTAGGTAPISYQWRKGNVAIAGATGSALVLNPIRVADGGGYDVVVTNACGSVTSNVATLAVNTRPAITTQPQSQSACPNGTATFTVGASGTAPLSYQWRKDGVAIAAATGALLTISHAQNADAASYDVVVTNTCGSVTSDAATLTLSTSPSIASHPQSRSACTGEAVTLTVTANGPAPLTHQWRKNGVPIAGETGATLTIGAVQAGDAGAYEVVVTNPCGSATSNAASLTILVPPTIITQPRSRTVCIGDGAVFAVVANGSIPLAYQWRKDGVAITGETGTTLTLGAVQAGDAGAYDVVVTNACGSVTSAAASLSTPSEICNNRIDDDCDGLIDGADPDCACPDTDRDGVCNADDLCPGRDDRLDRDGDGTPDGCDRCPDDANKTDPGICGCGVSDVDSDGDTLPDCADPFPNDPTNTPGGGTPPPNNPPPNNPPSNPTPPPPAPMPSMGGGICGLGSAASAMTGLLGLCGARLGRRSRRRPWTPGQRVR